MSLRILSNDSASSGGCTGSCARMAPGLSLGATRSDSISWRKSAIQSASSCRCLRNSSGEVSPSALIRDAGNPACNFSRCKRTLARRPLLCEHPSVMNCHTSVEKLIAEAHDGSMSIDRHFPFHGFDPHGEVDITRRRLPHWRQPGATYFITFRLADSLPQSVLHQWRHERAIWLRWHPPPWSADEQLEYEERFTYRYKNG
jgi:hypothetical protein